MQVKLKQAAIIAAITASLAAKGMVQPNQKVNIVFTQSRKGADAGLVADIEIPDEDDSVPTSNLPVVGADGPHAAQNADLQNAQANAEKAAEPAPAAAVETAKEPAKEGEAAPGKTLFS